MLEIQGSTALSPFRLRKLAEDIRQAIPAVTAISTRYIHLVDLSEDLNEREQDVLHKLLNYGPADLATKTSAPIDSSGGFFLVVPRPGKISPWSSKATAIANI